MLLKISLSGVKSRWKDYCVLFSGIIMASAIFYMFEAIALNKKFVSSTTVGQNARAVFILGSVLLIIITLVYVFYANNFLMSMRKHDYGLFMMLGAKRSKISKLISFETLIVGAASTLLGIVAGIGLTKIVSSFLITSLEIPIKYFQAIYVPAIWTTLILFMILFAIAGMINAGVFSRTAALKLLKSENQTDWKQPKTKRLVIQAVLGVLLLSGGYYAMYDIRQLQVGSIWIGLITIVAGTYLIFNSFFVMLLERIQQSSLNSKGINNFTIAQLKFRIRDYTKILSVVSLLFALALGAITVGIGFQSDIPEIANGNNAYAISATNPSAKMSSLIAKVEGKTTSHYQQKVTDKVVYYRSSDFNKSPLKYSAFVLKGNQAGLSQIKTSTLKQLKDPQSPAYQQLSSLQDPSLKSRRIRFISDTTFDQLRGRTNELQLIRVKDINSQYRSLKSVMDLQKTEFGSQTVQLMGESIVLYSMLKSMFSSMEFMGVFLGIAFLAMLASCLMFKILSGAQSDKVRFEMLNKIGTRKKVLQHSIMLQILGLFGLPAVLGLLDVAFGLQMFVKANLLYHAYRTFAYSSIGFLVLYLIYYGVTVLIYQKIVIPKTRSEK
ncbi:FtsX-like permease family protein [Lentilactobacillus hilgardii]|nr:ABC transporter permease [Lentilactobacillus hilgardii]KRK59152.1 peptide ABC superfamily ATP binding cassette transporter permease transmembrane protein [Lentilactobacillus hilgardii DSM 20176 = ATCC 8290]TDG85995.1 hypothetical protein C5L34_002156 [Lentilactobacillus hilgardii]